MKTLRAAIHVHSEWSYDGRWTLPALAQAFRRRGYDVVLMAEHDLGFSSERWHAYRDACAAATDAKIILVPGIEYSDATNEAHVAVWGAPGFLGEGLETGELLRRAQAADGVAVFNHPWRLDAWRRFDPSWTSMLLGIEVWNRKYDGWAPDARAVKLVADDARLVPFVGLDFHTARQFFPLSMELAVEGMPSETSIADALRSRRCRSLAFRVPTPRLSAGPGFAAARGAEHVRRTLARSVRQAARARRRRIARRKG